MPTYHMLENFRKFKELIDARRVEAVDHEIIQELSGQRMLEAVIDAKEKGYADDADEMLRLSLDISRAMSAWNEEQQRDMDEARKGLLTALSDTLKNWKDEYGGEDGNRYPSGFYIDSIGALYDQMMRVGEEMVAREEQKKASAPIVILMKEGDK